MVRDEIFEAADIPSTDISGGNEVAALPDALRHAANRERSGRKPKEMDQDAEAEFASPLQDGDLRHAAQRAFQSETLTGFEASFDLGEQKFACLQGDSGWIQRREAARDLVSIEESRWTGQDFEKSPREGRLPRAIATAEKVEGGTAHGPTLSQLSSLVRWNGLVSLRHSLFIGGIAASPRILQ